MILNFPKTKVLPVIEAAIKNNGQMMLVKDQGVYLLVQAKKAKDNVMLYAQGFDPNKDEDWYDKAWSKLGGDDFADRFGTTDFFKLLIEEKKHWTKFRVHVNKKSIKLSAV